MNRRSFLAATAGLAGATQLSTAAPAEGKFQLGSVTYNLLQNMDLETLIHTLEEVTGVRWPSELRTGHKHGVEPSLGADERVKVKERFQRSKVKLLSYGSTCEFQSPDPAVRAKQVEIGRSFVDLARDTGAIAVKVRPNGFPDGVPHATTIRNIGAGLHNWANTHKARASRSWMGGTRHRHQVEPNVAAEILGTAAASECGRVLELESKRCKGGQREAEL